jgi:hypothetical protein
VRSDRLHSVRCRARWELVVRRIVQANIDHYKELLKVETDATKRAMLIKLLAEEETKLKQSPKLEKKAY